MVCHWGEMLWFVNQLMYFKGFTPKYSPTLPQRAGREWIVICNCIYETFAQLRFCQDAQEKKAGPIKNPAFIALNSFLV